MTDRKFDHDWRSCSRTYATLCIYHDAMAAGDISTIIGVEPDWIIAKGEVRALKRVAQLHGWFRTTRDVEESRDVKWHVFTLLEQIPDCASSLSKLKNLNCDISVSCFWESASGNGGPGLDHEFLKWLAQYPINLDFDVWLSPEE